MKQTIFIANAFSLSMLDREEQSKSKGVGTDWGDGIAPWPRIPRPIGDPVSFLADQEFRANDVGIEIQIISAVGHPDTARVFSEILARDIRPNRTGIRLEKFQYVLVGQLVTMTGLPYRLPEGVTRLPEDAHIEWWVI